HGLHRSGAIVCRHRPARLADAASQRQLSHAGDPFPVGEQQAHGLPDVSGEGLQAATPPKTAWSAVAPVSSPAGRSASAPAGATGREQGRPGELTGPPRYGILARTPVLVRIHARLVRTSASDGWRTCRAGHANANRSGKEKSMFAILLFLAYLAVVIGVNGA